MTGPAETGLLREAVIFLAAAAVMVPLFSRFKLGAVLGYLMAGMLIGPFGFKLISETEDVLKFGEYGIVLLLFVIGLELQPAKLWALRRDIFGFGTAQVVFCGIALSLALLVFTSLSWQSALVVGLSLALSSTALVVQYLQEKGELNSPTGERSFSALLLQDLAIVPLLIIVAAFSRVPANPDAPEGIILVATSVAAIVGLVLVGRFVLNPALKLFGQVGSRDIFVIAALLTVLGSSLLMASFGLSMAMGAFIAGVMLADSPYRHELEADIEPFRGLLLGLFFLAIGMTLDTGVVLANPMRVLLLVILLISVKTLVISVLARGFGTPWRQAVQMALLLSQGGEFAFVLLSASVAALLILPEAGSLFSAVVTLSMLVSLILTGLFRRFMGGRVEQNADGLEGPEKAEEDMVIVLGYGRFGQIVTQLLHARGTNVVLIDTKPDQIEESRRFGWKVYYGDGFRPDVLRVAGADSARLLIVTTGGAWAPSRLDAVRHSFPHLRVLVRAHDRLHYMRLVSADIDLVVRELYHSALEVGRIALRELGTPEESIEAITEEYVRRDKERLALQVASGDLMAGRDSMFRPGHGWKPEHQETALGEIPPAEMNI